MKRWTQVMLLIGLTVLPLAALAGNLDSPGAPTTTAGHMPTLQELYDYLTTGAAPGAAALFQEPAAGPTAGTMKTLLQLYTDIKALFDQITVTAANVRAGQKYFSTVPWGIQTGTMPEGTNVTGGNGLLTFTLPNGYYAGKTATAADTNLTAANIKSGVTIFGVNGSAVQASGTATAAQVLSGATFSNTSGASTGMMSNNGAVTMTPGAAAQTIAAGYHNGSGTVAGDANLTAANIKSGVSIFGVAGSPKVMDTTTGTAAAGDLLSGKIAFVNGAQITGSLATQTVNNATVSQPAGIYAAFNLATMDTDLATGNIKSGVSIFGVNGKTEVVDTTEATSPVTAADMLSGKKAFVNGAQITGAMPSYTSGGLIVPDTVHQPLPAGYYDGSYGVMGDSELTAANIKSGVTIFGVTGTVLQSSGDATAADVLTGKTFSNGTNAGVSGSMANHGAVTITPGATAQSIAAGYHNGSGTVAGDANLVTANIKSGVSIFGVAGTLSGGGGGTSVPKTGQTGCWDASGDSIACAGTGQDGDLQKGVAWPNPRFTNNGNGTVTDNLTRLIWLKNANCWGTAIWATALANANGLASLSCGLTDGSTAGQWRLPNLREMQSLIHYGYTNPAVPNTDGTGQWTAGNPFLNVQNDYWTSMAFALNPTLAWIMSVRFGNVDFTDKAAPYFAWAVR